jgi:hypothetical protein
VPATPLQASAWLARHPDDTDATRGARVWSYLVLGDLEAARRLAGHMPEASASDRFHRVAAEALVRLVEGGDPGLDDLRARAVELDDAQGGEAAIDIALLAALVAAADGGDWRGPVLAIRERVERARRLAFVRWFLPVVGLIALGALLMTLVAYGFSIIVV